MDECLSRSGTPRSGTSRGIRVDGITARPRKPLREDRSSETNCSPRPVGGDRGADASQESRARSPTQHFGRLADGQQVVHTLGVDDVPSLDGADIMAFGPQRLREFDETSGNLGLGQEVHVEGKKDDLRPQLLEQGDAGSPGSHARDADRRQCTAMEGDVGLQFTLGDPDNLGRGLDSTGTWAGAPQLEPPRPLK